MKKIFAFLLVLTMVLSMAVTASAAPVAEATIDMTRKGSINLWKYDVTNAEKDGVWDSSYVSTGVRDETGVEAVLNQARHGDSDANSDLGNGQNSVGYAIRGVEFTYFKVADIRTYTESESGVEHVEVLYGIKPNATNLKFLQAIGVAYADRYAAADQTVDGEQVYYFQSDVLINGLANALDYNATKVKNALESYMAEVGGTAMPITDGYGHSAANNLPLGLYLFVETKVPEMVTSTTNPFLVSVPMTSVNGDNATDGGERWIYDVAIYPKNLTGIPSLEKTVRETKDDTGKNNGSTVDITDGFKHTATASGGDVLDNQIISTMPSITSASTYLTAYTFVDTMDPGMSFKKNDVKIEFFKDAACTTANKVATWAESDGKFTVSYTTTGAGESVMTISMTAAGLNEINTASTVYTSPTMVNSGYSDCTLRITYQVILDGQDKIVYGDEGNENKVAMTWKRSNTDFWDALVDDAHIYTYGIDLTKVFSDNRGDFSKVEFIIHNDTDNYFVTGELKDGIWYVKDHVSAEADATHFIPQTNGVMYVKGLEDDTYTITEVRTDNAYTLLKDSIKVEISQEETTEYCDIYSSDALGLLQNDPRFREILAPIVTDGGLVNPLLNIPQKQLAHHLLTASAKVDGNDVTMENDSVSLNAFAPMKVVNTRGFDLPQTGGNGNWMFPAFGLAGFGACMILFFLLLKKKDGKKEDAAN